MAQKIYRIAAIPGDGIGPEVVAEGIKVLERAAALDGGFSFQFTHFPWGCEYYLKTGRMMPPDGIEQLRGFDAILFGDILTDLGAAISGGTATTAEVGDAVAALL